MQLCNKLSVSKKSEANKTIMKIPLITLLLFLNAFSIFAQPDSSETKYDARLLKYYSVAELDDMSANNPSEYQKIEYYHTSSYFIENYSMTDCVAFDTAYFDVSLYENRRSWNSRITIDLTEKYCVKIILLSSIELTYPLTIHESQIQYHQNN
jgi:hypothetical protein